MIALQLETRGNCNARCHFCPYPQNMKWRASGVMSDELFYKIVDEAVTIPLITLIMFHGLNEPLLDKRLEAFITYVKSKKPGLFTVIFTNGVFLRPERFDSLKAAGLDSLVVSLNANTPEQHEKIMGLKGVFDKTVSNIEYAIANQGNMAVEVHAVANGDTFTSEDAREFKHRWGVVPREGGTGYGLLVAEGNWASDNRTIYDFKPNEWCARATGSIYVLYDGTVSACCFDPLGKEKFGNLENQTLREIYSGDKYVQFRQDHVNDEADKWEICKKCSRI